MIRTMNSTEDESRHAFEQVQTVLKELLPAMQADGGGVELTAVVDDVVTVRLIGTCVRCPSKNLTLKHGIERTLREKLPWIKSVERTE